MSNGAITIENVELVKETARAKLFTIQGINVWVPTSKSHYIPASKQLSLPKWLWDNINAEIQDKKRKLS